MTAAALAPDLVKVTVTVWPSSAFVAAPERVKPFSIAFLLMYPALIAVCTAEASEMEVSMLKELKESVGADVSG